MRVFYNNFIKFSLHRKYSKIKKGNDLKSILRNNQSERLYKQINADLSNNNIVNISSTGKRLAKLNVITPNKEELESYSQNARKILNENIKNAGSEIKWSNGYIPPSKLYRGKSINYENSEVSLNRYVEDADEKVYNRDMINNQLSNIFSENGISFDSKNDFTFTVDPYDYKISVTGGDENTNREMENILNTGQNGVNLYTHIYFCAKDGQNSQQLSKEGQLKRYVNSFTKETIGVDLRYCTKTDDDYITSNGESVKQLLSEYVDREESIDKTGFKKLCSHYIDQVLPYDYNEGCTQNLSIKFNSDTGLHDILQDNDFGVGNRDWISDIIKSSEKTVFTSFI